MLDASLDVLGFILWGFVYDRLTVCGFRGHFIVCVCEAGSVTPSRRLG